MSFDSGGRDGRGLFHPARRRFVQGLAAGGVAAGLGLWPRDSRAGGLQVLQGTRFHLTVGELPVDFTGHTRPAVTVNGSLPGPLLRWREGTTVEIDVANALPHGSVHGHQASIHWHGLLLPANMDGVPGVSFAGIGRGETFRYRFDIRQAGTYWYHSHSAFQEQAGVYGPIVIDPAGPDRYDVQRDYVVMLNDWTDLDPAALLRRLKAMPGHDNWYRRTVGDFLRDAREDGLAATLADRRMWGAMRMTPTDLSDVNGHTYTYLMNGATSLGNWTGLFRHGEKLRLRFINGSSMTYFDVRIPGLRMTVVEADGQPVHPVTVDEFRIAAAETFDVIVEPAGQDAFTVFAQDSARTGYVSGTLAVREGLRAPVPALDPRPVLTMADMGHGDAGHGAHAAAAPSAAGMQHAGHDMAGMTHGAHDMAAMQHAGMDHGAHATAGMDHAGHDMAAMGHAMPGMAHGGVATQSHPATERGNPFVDMQAMAPTPRLDDPGVGLRDNGRRVLTYADLRSAFDDPDGREPGREIELHLTGHMERFVWSFDGVKFSGAQPLRLNYGERMRVVLVNDTMMSHPIHLHGMWSDLEDEQGDFQVRKHTVNMPPGTRRSYRVRADALGNWAYHCHLLYHMEAGMMRVVSVEERA